MTVNGLDVSGYVPIWRGQGFGMVKATEAFDYQNPAFKANWDGMYEHNVQSRFAYHYAHPDLDPSKQAAYFVAFVKAHGLLQHDHFVLDLEQPFGRTPAQVSFWAHVFCEEVQRLAPGHRVLVYTNPWFAEQGYCASLGNRYLWIANYDAETPEVPPPWKTWTFWQLCGGSLVDHDWFNGSASQLAEFTSHAGSM